MMQKKIFFLFLFFCLFVRHNCSASCDQIQSFTTNGSYQESLRSQSLIPGQECEIIVEGSSCSAKYLGTCYRFSLIPLDLAPGEKTPEIIYDPNSCGYYEIIDELSETKQRIDDQPTLLAYFSSLDNASFCSCLTALARTDSRSLTPDSSGSWVQQRQSRARDYFESLSSNKASLPRGKK